MTFVLTIALVAIGVALLSRFGPFILIALLGCGYVAWRSGFFDPHFLVCFRYLPWSFSWRSAAGWTPSGAAFEGRDDDARHRPLTPAKRSA
jgi:hypothetical protein